MLGQDLDPPIWTVVLYKGEEQQMHQNITFTAMMTLLITPLGLCLNRPEQHFRFEVYQAGKLRLKIESFSDSAGGGQSER